jgi:23S rRNA pseudouridine2605 synthase
MRINKALAALGFGSRRSVEELITSGKVSINGQAVSDLSAQVDPETDRIVVAGKRAPKKAKTHIIIFNKPRGVLSTWNDERGRKCLADYFPPIGSERVFAVGRLDRDSEGLLLLTNDGDLANVLMHPRGGVPRTYEVIAEPVPSAEDITRLSGETKLDDGPAKPLRVRPHPSRAADGFLTITLAEGRNRIVRRIFTAHGFEVKRLRRVEFGGVNLGNLKSGENRRLTPAEESRLRKAAGLAPSDDRR